MAAPRDLTRATLMVGVVGVLTLGTFFVLRPFLPALVWAATIVVATWPLLLRLQRVLWHSRALAVTVTTLLTLIVFVVPFWLATSTILGHFDQLTALAHEAATFRLPEAPQWLHDLPLIGPGAASAWNRLGESGLGELLPRLAPYAGRLARWFVAGLGGFGLLVLQFLLTVVIAAILHATGETAAGLVMRFGRRLSGERGERMVVLAGHSVRAVAIGVMVTSLVESVVGGIGLAVTGVPLAAVLTAVMFVVCVTQVGPGLVMIPAVVWMYLLRDAGWATVLLAFTVVAITIDNVLRPLLIREEADLPTLLVLAGVIGGLTAFGLIGIFVGPAILAVSYTVLRAWLAEEPATEADP